MADIRDEKFYSVSEVAKLLHVGHSTVNSWIKQGQLKAVKMVGLWRIPESSLKRFLSKGGYSDDTDKID